MLKDGPHEKAVQWLTANIRMARYDRTADTWLVCDAAAAATQTSSRLVTTDRRRIVEDRQRRFDADCSLLSPCLNSHRIPTQIHSHFKYSDLLSNLEVGDSPQNISI